MKKLFRPILAMVAVCCAACSPNGLFGGWNDTKFEISVSEISDTSATISVVPSNDNTYYFDVVPLSEFSSYSRPKDFAADIAALIQQVSKEYGFEISDYLSSGRDVYTNDMLEANTSYVAYAFGLSSEGEVTTDVAITSFKTLETQQSGYVDLSTFTFGYYENYGDYYETNAANWYIDLYTENTNEMMVVEVQTPLGATSFTGTYPLASTFRSGTAVAGGVDAEGYLYGTYWGLLDDAREEFFNVVFFTAGEVIITKGSGNTYIITMVAHGEDGTEYTLSYSGVLEEWVDDESSSATTRALAKPGSRRLRCTAKLDAAKVVKPTNKIFKYVVAK